MKNTKIELKTASEVFNRVWELDDEKLEKMDTDFMNDIKELLWIISREDEGQRDLTSSYDIQPLNTIIKIIDKFNGVYHLVNTTHGWTKDD